MKANTAPPPYSLTFEQSKVLASMIEADSAGRRAIALDYAAKNGVRSLAELIGQFVGLSLSVAENTRNFVEMFAITDGDMNPHQAEQINFPTIEGALVGAVMAKDCEQDGLCEGCAFRIGTEANQSVVTVRDALDCASPGEQPFMCHMDMDEQGDPTKGCVGAARMRAAEKANRKAAA